MLGHISRLAIGAVVGLLVGGFTAAAGVSAHASHSNVVAGALGLGVMIGIGVFLFFEALAFTVWSANQAATGFSNLDEIRRQDERRGRR